MGKPRRQKIVQLKGEIQKHQRGFAFLIHQPKDLFIPPELAKHLCTGDVVKAWINPSTNDVIRVEPVSRGLRKFIGTYEPRFGKRVVVLTERNMREEVTIPDAPKLVGLREGHKVLVEVTRYEPRLEGRILQSFGASLAPKHDTLAVVTRSNWPTSFQAEVEAEAEHLSQEIHKIATQSGFKGRRDLRSKHFITIDGADARDFDDAILVEKTESGFVLYVAIADVAEFVRSGTDVDKEAYARATSVYFPEWVIPMLPEALSNGSCSLRPNEDKLTLTAEIHYDKNGHKRSSRVYESVICSKRRCIYEDVQREHEAHDVFWTPVYELFEILQKIRIKRGSIDFDLPETQVVLDENSDTTDIIRRERLDSHRLIEEFMIAANETVTEIMERERWPFVYRVHEPPKPEALERFEKFAIGAGYKPKFSEQATPQEIARFLSELDNSERKSPWTTILHYLLLRSLTQARYDSVNLKHFGLASKAYTHFTSPIRRYPDLIVHRILKRFVRREAYRENEIMQFEEYLSEACEHCSKQERKAEDLDRKVIKVKKARFMSRYLGQEFSARITNINENGLFVELDEIYVEGLVPISEVGDDFFEFNEEKVMLKGKRSGLKFKLADSVQVTVLRTDVENGFIDFTLCRSLRQENKLPKPLKMYSG